MYIKTRETLYPLQKKLVSKLGEYVQILTVLCTTVLHPTICKHAFYKDKSIFMS
jgi:hypothetical protein